MRQYDIQIAFREHVLSLLTKLLKRLQNATTQTAVASINGYMSFLGLMVVLHECSVLLYYCIACTQAIYNFYLSTIDAHFIIIIGSMGWHGWNAKPCICHCDVLEFLLLIPFLPNFATAGMRNRKEQKA